MKNLKYTRLLPGKLIMLAFVSLLFFFSGCKKEDLIPGGGGGGSTPTMGSFIFWTASDFGCGNITVTVNGISKMITGPYSSMPPCGASGGANFELAPGTYTYSASCTGLNWTGSITITAGGCQALQLTAAGGGGGGGGGSTTGQGMFWIASDLGCGNISVTVNGVTKTITQYYSSGAPACGASGCATFDLPAGTYAFTASCTSKNWNGNITIIAGNCSRSQLTSSGGIPTTGQGMFWTASDLGCGNINVTVNGVTKTITQFYSSGTPPCGQVGCATFDLAPGTYNYTASCSGKNWSGTINITTGGCNRIQLTSSGGPTPGQLTFWVRSDLGCGPISVTCNGVTRTITQYYSGGAPNCGATGCATFVLNPGTYSFTASCSGRNWSGSNTVTASGCMMAELF